MASGENPTSTPDRPTHSGATGWEALIPLDWNRLRELSNEPVPNHLKRWWFSLGGTPAYLFLIQITTGILLLFYYQPNAADAWESVARITHDISFGWFIRSVHKWSANLMIVTVILHLLRVFFTRSYRHPRELNWVFGVVLLLMTLSFGFTGYSLVYEQLSFWGATVAANLTDSIPIVGAPMATLIRGGPEIGPQTLTRLYLLHIGVLPALMIAVLGLHLTFIRLHGVTEYEFDKAPTKKVGGSTAVAGILAAVTAAGAIFAAYAAFSGVTFDLVGSRFGPSGSRTVFLMMAATLGAGAVGLWMKRLPGLLIFFTGAMLMGAKLLRDILLSEADDPGTASIGLAAVGIFVLVGLAFHRVFTDKDDPDDSVKHFNFFPDHALTELMIGTGLLGLLTLLSLVFPAELGEKANPLVTPEHIKPEWYFYFQFRVLKLTSLTVSVALTGMMLAILFLWPWLDRLLERVAPRKNLPLVIGVVGFLVFLVFTVWEAMLPLTGDKIMSLNTKRIVIFLLGLFLAAALLMVADQERRRHLSPEDMSLAQVTALVKDDSAACVDCHATKSPGVTKQWQHSMHAQKGVGCNDCHRADKNNVMAWNHEGAYITSIVTPATCAECHPTENVEFAASHHNTAGMILHSKDNMLGEFVCGGPNAVLGCKQCHGSQVSFTKHFEDGSAFTLDLVGLSFEAMDDVMKDLNIDLGGMMKNKKALTAKIKSKIDAAWAPHAGKEPKKDTRLDIDPQTWPNSGMGRFNPDGTLGSCNACHSRHEFSKALARQPENCGKCHMGPDHPQIEIFNESKHGIAFRNQLNEMNLDHPEWVVGRDYSAAPTCATCHMSRYETADGIQPPTHDVGLRISWTLRPPISKLWTSRTATIGEDGEIKEMELAWDKKRNDMKDVCSACHSNSHIEGFYSQYDALVNLYNEKFAKPGAQLFKRMKDKGYLDSPDAKGFAHEMAWIWFELWHHEGRRMRHGAAMMGPDYTHWHGTYEVAKHFYVKYIPKVLKIAKENGSDTLTKMVKEILSRPEHAWYDGQDKAEVDAIRKTYSGYDKLHLKGN